MKPDLIIDVATLTGAISVALGSSHIGVFSNAPPDILAQLSAASVTSGERIWQMPISTFEKQLSSDVADVCNVATSSDKSGGACVAAAFLHKFAKKHKWIHLDIAGVMQVKSSSGINPKGMTGASVRTLIEFLQIRSNKNGNVK